MSKQCNFKYSEYHVRANILNTMNKEEWEKWFSENCNKCKYMCEVCMYGEVERLNCI